MEWPVGMSATREDRTCPPSQNHWVSMGLPRGKTLGKDGGKGRRPVRVWEVADVLGPSGRPLPEPSAVTVAQGFSEGRWRT